MKNLNDNAFLSIVIMNKMKYKYYENSAENNNIVQIFLFDYEFIYLFFYLKIFNYDLLII